MAPDLSRLAINQITTPSWDMGQAVDGYAWQGITGIAVWRHKMYEYGVARTARLLKDAEAWTPCFCSTAWMNQNTTEGFRAAVEENRRVIADAAEIGSPNVVLVSGGIPAGSKDLAGFRARIRDALAELDVTAREHGIQLGIEPIHPMYASERSCVSSIRQANDLILELGDKFGLVADVYHCWWDIEFEEELTRIGPERIMTFHWCDWLSPTKSSFDRGMPGDGVIDLPHYRQFLDDLGYDGPFELELFSEADWWKRDPEEVVRIGIERCAHLSGPRPAAEKQTRLHKHHSGEHPSMR